MIKANTLFLITAPSGSGKTSIMRNVMNNEIVSFTTRDKRKGEVDGIDYIYITKEEFNGLLKSGGLAEQTKYPPNAKEPDCQYYGITMNELKSKLENGSAFVIVDYHGMQQLKTLYNHTVSIFIKTHKQDAIMNMLKRGDTPDAIAKRVETYDLELENRVHYDYVVSNQYGRMFEAVNIIKEIVKQKG